MEDNVIIRLKDVCKKFNNTYAVENFNLYVNKGEFVTFLGPSGCGKTTTLRMIAGFELPTSGSITLNGQDITLISPHMRPVNTVFQRYALFQHLDVYDNIAFGLRLKKIKDEKTGKMRKLTSKEIDEKVLNALKIVDLEEYEDRDVTTLSGGQQQRVAIARAIVNEPEILLLDEPLGALDLKMRKDMQLELKQMHKKLGITFIYVTHDQEEALTMSDIIVVMKDGQIQQIGTPTDIYNEPKNAFVADFIGESNIYNATYRGDKTVRFLNHNFACVDDQFTVNEKVDVVVRPEDVMLGEVGKGMVDGKIVTKVFKGIHYQYVFMVGKNEVVIQDTRDFPVDSNASISIEPDMIHIMKKELNANVYQDAYIDNKNRVVIANTPFECDVAQVLPNSHLDDDGYLIGPKGKKYDLNDADVIASINLTDVEICENEEDGMVPGVIVSVIYKGDHYQVTVRTEDEEDFVVETEYTYNETDRVSINIAKEKISLSIKGDISKYEI